MAQVKSLDIEKRMKSELSNLSFKKDKEVMKKIVDGLPVSSKVRVYKQSDDGNKMYISTVNADNFKPSEPYEWVKSRYFEKYGGGDYELELLDGNGHPLTSYSISIISDEDKEEPEKAYLGAVKESMNMREQAMEKVIKAEEKMREAERAKYESTLDIINRNWESISKLYETRLEELKAKDNTSRPELENIKRELDNTKKEFENEIRRHLEKKESSDKMFDLMNSLIPTIIAKSTDKGKDPVAEFQSMYSIVKDTLGDKKDLIESMVENPQKLEIFKKLLGLDTAQIQPEERKDFFSEMIENPQKAEVFKKIMGMEEKKDMVTEFIENPKKFEIFKRMMGIQEVVNTPPPVVEKKKDFLEELVDVTSKLSSAKPVLMNLLGVQPQPAKNILEFLGNVMANVGPHIVKAVENVGKNMVLREMINKGLVKSYADIASIESGHALPPQEGYSGMPKAAKPKTEPKQKRQRSKKLDLEKEFIDIIVSATSGSEAPIETTVFIDKVSTNVINFIKKHPSLIFEFSSEEKRKKITDIEISVIERVLGIDNEQATAISMAIENTVSYKMFGKIIHNMEAEETPEPPKKGNSKDIKQKKEKVSQQSIQ